MAYERAEPKYGLSVEQGTERVPDDGRYHVLVDGKVVLSTAVESLARAELDDLKTARQAQGRELLRRERAAHDIHAFRSANYAQKQGRDAQKGGRGIGRK